MTSPLRRRAAVLALCLAMPLPALGQEEVEVHLPDRVVFEVADLAAGPVAARGSSVLALHRIQLAPGKALAVSVQMESGPPGAALAFSSRNPRGGTCGAGRLVAGAPVLVFESLPQAVAGGCEILWTLESPGRVRRAGPVDLALRWSLEAVGREGVPGRGPGTGPGLPREGAGQVPPAVSAGEPPGRAGSLRPRSPAADGRQRRPAPADARP